ncbi:HypC/HybG/HupF family hydrogenase formation chaperone [Fastidiosibacter lacustris]|uniref:HypC/HybG/HupF family hydrogenase formation chaperone n=1 Tax=Fastidiosibacter lacustris TaxID=2056695 RepID=UPI000E356162|nr:HypC/HybG/HupF family hydrogenase formation chaperone [Fastidiosibacter lacustris]
MCLAIPAQVIALKKDQQALVNVGGVHKEISLVLLAENIKVGEYVLVHVGFALSKLNEEKAKQTLADFAQMLKQ